MNTPAHIAASLFCWRDTVKPVDTAALMLGAALPDLPMFGFYAYQKLAGRSEHDIWTTHYFDSQWQLFFDWFNSIPLAIVCLIVFRVSKIRWAELLCSSAILHMLCDLPLHHDDGHRHFLPFSHWRFESPVSYWDPAHFGIYVAIAELVLAIGALAYVVWTARSLSMRAASVGTLTLYGAGLIFALVMWM